MNDVERKYSEEDKVKVQVPSPFTTYQRLNLYRVKILHSSSTPTYLVYHKYRETFYAMKLFPLKGKHANPEFKRECLSFCFDHPNLLPARESEERREFESVISKNMQVTCSYVLKELATYGDFCELVMNERIPKKETVIRTYFIQFIDALDTLHSSGIAHMNLKLENLFLCNDYMLKLGGFKCVYLSTDEKMFPGTRNYRSPEVREGRCKDPIASDIYSAGVVLFVMMFGLFPYDEENYEEGIDMQDMLFNEQEIFWEAFYQINDKAQEISKGFKKLFIKMCSYNPKRRPSIVELKKSEWYTGPRLSDDELEFLMSQNVQSKIPKLKPRKSIQDKSSVSSKPQIKRKSKQSVLSTQKSDLKQTISTQKSDLS